MLTIQKIEVNNIQENCYIVSDETGEAVIIDPGMFYSEECAEVENYIKDNNLKLVHLVNTHGHFDHTYSNRFVYETFGLKVEIHLKDAILYQSLGNQIENFLRRKLDHEPAPIGKELCDGDSIAFGNHKLAVLHIPGHTPGGLCFHCADENVVFSGDSIFYRSIGRTDFPGGNENDLISSLQEKILTLPTDTVIYPGHGPQTTVGAEQKGNLYLR